MTEVQIPQGVKVKISDDKSEVVVEGKLGSTVKKVNTTLLGVAVQGDKLIVTETKNKKLAKKAVLACQALSSEFKSSMEGVENGIQKRMKIIYAHFPMSVEIKGNEVRVKNVFGEKLPRIAKIVGVTKVEVKGQDVLVKGVDPYDVGQTAANLHRLSFVRRKDTRVFQDGIYYVGEE